MAEPFEHGLSAYRKHGCRCGVCRKANADRAQVARERRRRLVAMYPHLIKHGTSSGYVNDGCRCAACREAIRLQNIAYRGGLRRPMGGRPTGG